MENQSKFRSQTGSIGHEETTKTEWKIFLEMFKYIIFSEYT